MNSQPDFNHKLKITTKTNNSLVCVGLDPHLSKIPPHLLEVADSIFKFNKAIIDSTHDLVCAYKPQIAYFSAASAEDQLERTIHYIQTNYPLIPVILDAKRGDIGSTAEHYAREAFHRYHADAVTVNPYMGYDSAKPFLDFKDRGIIFLCRTSNSGASDIQDLLIDNQPLYEKVATMISQQWNKNNNCLLVVGATWPSQMEKIRSIIGEMPLLVPGVGAQGGDVEKIIKAGQTRDGQGLIISSSRTILYASREKDFAQAARVETSKLRDNINQYRHNSHH